VSQPRPVEVRSAQQMHMDFDTFASRYPVSFVIEARLAGDYARKGCGNWAFDGRAGLQRLFAIGVMAEDWSPHVPQETKKNVLFCLPVCVPPTVPPTADPARCWKRQRWRIGNPDPTFSDFCLVVVQATSRAPLQAG
jgi:hypothetical protein